MIDNLARQTLLDPAGLGESELSRLVGTTFGQGIDGGDCYFQFACQEGWSLEDGIVKSASFNIERGAGIRVVRGEQTGFAYSDDLAMPALLEAAGTARSIARAGQSGGMAVQGRTPSRELYVPDNPIDSLDEQEKIDLLKEVDAEARAADPRVTQVMCSLAGSREVVMVLNARGELTTDVRPLVRLNVQVIVEQGGRRESGSSGGGGRFGYRQLIENGQAAAHAREAVRQALVNLEAVDAPAGSMKVVLGPGWPGVLLHEAIGHGLEGDFNRKGTSAFAGRIGERVAAEGITIVDDGTLAGRRGSLNVDDEGNPTEETVLIEDGILRGYMQDELNARLSGTQTTGNGRRESYAHLPMPRMTNTYMLGGSADPEEIIGSVEDGLYAVNFGGGQVDITSGKFVFSASEAYLIENGKVTRPVKGATLIGNGPDVLTRVSMVGNDMQLDPGVGTCGKEGQGVPVGVGQPTLRIDGMTVGGTQAA
ncbi:MULTISPECIES: metalloprotease TldD [unclassified Thioalkalivibrio]|uniref:metalloprotease TldD n=1 Tax=unclassified Thioalkalivibrio TaxID=2621013 RepID=UPI0003706629|nr:MULTISPECIES: metalloprotease TldD [unclassified Thioalkalivibrio]